MFGFCQDPLIAEIQRKGYSLLPLAEAGIAPLQVLGRHGRRLFRYSDVNTIFLAGATELPQVKLAIDVAPIDETETMALDNGLGLSVLSKWFGGKTSLNGRLNRSSKLKLKLGKIDKQEVDLGLLDAFLVNATLRFEMPAIEELLDADSLYVVSAVLRTKSLELVSEVGELLSGDGSVPDLGSGISGKIRVSAQGNDKRHILLNADEPVVFAFQAVRALYDNGRYETIRPERKNLKLMSEEERSPMPQETGWLCDQIGSGFVRFDKVS
jgi:hypothetical protein